jgi:hypothetical protein
MQRLNRQVCWLAIVVAFLAAAAWAGGPPAITISGGVAKFVNPNGCFGDQPDEDGFFGESNFSVSANIDAEGNVTGQFICMVKECAPAGGNQLTIIGKFTDVLDFSEDPDVVSLGGVAKVEVQGLGIVAEFPFTVELQEGPPGVGKFIYDDPAVPDPGDEEVVSSGHIMINFH